jgi:ABC-type transport system involved in cytochrome c biogenesis permease subunit
MKAKTVLEAVAQDLRTLGFLLFILSVLAVSFFPEEARTWQAAATGAGGFVLWVLGLWQHARLKRALNRPLFSAHTVPGGATARPSNG